MKAGVWVCPGHSCAPRTMSGTSWCWGCELLKKRMLGPWSGLSLSPGVTSPLNTVPPHPCQVLSLSLI